VSDASTPRPYAAYPVRIGVQLQPQHAEYADLRRAVAEAEELGVDVVFNWDHFYPLYGDPDGKHFEAWTMLGAWAEQTSRVQLGSLVTCNSYRNPDLLADMARTLDHVSDGRLILGIGAGWFEKDYENFGYEFGTAGRRLAALGDALPRIEARLAAGNPAPTRKIPVLIGGGGETKTLRLVARHADIWHGFGDAAVIEHKHAVLDQWCVTEGRDPGAIERSAEVNNQGRRTDPATNGDALYALGTRLFTLGINGPDYDLSPAADWIAWRDDKNAS
jgi:probable F420-dependent oxidoreductase